MRNVRLWQVQVDGGGATYSANGLARVQLVQLGGMSKAGLDGNTTYLAGIMVRATNAVLNSTGGTITPQANKMHDFFRRVYVGGGSWTYYNFPFYGGQCLRIMRKLFGRNAEFRADTVNLANAGTDTERLRYFIPFFDPRQRLPEHTMPTAKNLKDIVLEMNYANGVASGEWGALTSTSSGGIDEITAVLVDKDEFRKEPKWQWFEKQLQSSNDAVSLPPGAKYNDVTLFPRQSPGGGVSNTYVAQADITKLEYTEDNEVLLRNMSVNNTISCWNAEQSLDDLVDLPIFEKAVANNVEPFGNEFVPVKWLSRGRRMGLTAGDLVSTNPVFNLTGSLTPANYGILARASFPTTEDDLVNAMVTAGIRPSDDFLGNLQSRTGKRKYSKAKSDKGNKVREDKAQFLAQAVVPSGVK